MVKRCQDLPFLWFATSYLDYLFITVIQNDRFVCSDARDGRHFPFVSPAPSAARAI